MEAAKIALSRYAALIAISMGEAHAARMVRKRSKMESPRRAAIFRNGVNQAVRLPQTLRFPDKVREVKVCRQGRGIVITPVRPSWSTFFNKKVKVPDDFLVPRDGDAPQEREPLR
ncbi:MAG: type II toxin-antitoxin system VapB family antitoxin [Steroidobacteraceae bacterium]|jgi:antitoxin VapB